MKQVMVLDIYPMDSRDRFAEGCADDQINKPVRVTDMNRTTHQGKLIAYEVVATGRAMRVHLEVDTEDPLYPEIKPLDVSLPTTPRPRLYQRNKRFTGQKDG